MPTVWAHLFLFIKNKCAFFEFSGKNLVKKEKIMKKIGIVMGSASDMPTVKKAADMLEKFGVPYEMHIYSAHRTPEQARDFAVNARERGFGAIIAAAGMAAPSST